MTVQQRHADVEKNAFGTADSANTSSIDQREYPIGKSPEPNVENSTLHGVAERGHAATDKYGRSLVQFDPVAESKLRRKIDFCIIPTVSLLYLFCFIDRANIGNAKLAKFEEDLGLKGYDFNIVLTAFYISYIVFEIPSNIACKWIGPGWFLPTVTLGFGILSICNAFVTNRATACIVRFILGIFESGMLPGIAYYMSRWYRRSELTFRLSMYIVMSPLAGAFGGLLASAILKLPNFGSLVRWKMIFAIEGTITCGLAIIAFFTLTDRPETARWLSQEEKDLATARLKSERVAATEVLDKLQTRKMLLGIFSPVTVVTSFIFLFDNVTVQGLGFFLPTIVKTIYPERSVISQQLYTVPPYAVGACFTMAFPFASWKLDRRGAFLIVTSPIMMTGFIMFLASSNSTVRYAACFLVASGSFAYGALTSSHVSANVVSDTARSAAIGNNAMFGCIGGLVSTWSYLPYDGPDYHIGNGINLATSSIIFILAVLMQLWMVWDNKRRDKRDIDQELAGLSEAEIEALDWKHPGFRWKL